MRRPRNASVIPSRGIVPPVGNGLSVICTDMWRHIIWIWPSCGGAWCPGALCGRARRRTAWITSGGRTMYRGTLNRPVWRKCSRRGLSSARFGWMPSRPAIRVCPLTSCCSARLISRWRISLQEWVAASCASEGLPRMSESICVTGNGIGIV